MDLCFNYAAYSSALQLKQNKSCCTMDADQPSLLSCSSSIAADSCFNKCVRGRINGLFVKLDKGDTDLGSNQAVRNSAFQKRQCRLVAAPDA
jgi:hypothetical protein